MGKQAILLVHFGTSRMDALERAVWAVERETRAAYPGWEVRGAFTNRVLLQILQKHGIQLQQVPEALNALKAEGCRRVIIQPTYVICGEEYEKLRSLAETYRMHFAQLAVGRPLLSSTEDMRKICRFCAREFPRKEGEALVLMGHGTTHFANAVYPAMGYLFLEMGFDRIFIGVTEGYPDISVVRRELKRSAVRKVTLAPLLLTAGGHAINDMAGDGPDSWKSLLKSDGYEVETVMRGLGEYSEVRVRYLDHIRDAISELEEGAAENRNI